MNLNELPTRKRASASQNEPMKEDETPRLHSSQETTLYDYIVTGDVVCSNPTTVPGESANVESTDVELTTCAAYGTNVTKKAT